MKLFVTYGFGTNQGNNYSVVEGANYGEALEKVFTAIGEKFAFTYDDEEDFKRQIEQYHLTEIPLTPQGM